MEGIADVVSTENRETARARPTPSTPRVDALTNMFISFVGGGAGPPGHLRNRPEPLTQAGFSDLGFSERNCLPSIVGTSRQAGSLTYQLCRYLFTFPLPLRFPLKLLVPHRQPLLLPLSLPLWLLDFRGVPLALPFTLPFTLPWLLLPFKLPLLEPIVRRQMI